MTERRWVFRYLLPFAICLLAYLFNARMSASNPALFSPIKVGRVNLQHRIALCPLTRYRATKAHTPIVPVVREYYRQRGSAGGTLLITEGTFISPEAGGLDNVPGIWSDEQIEAWKQVCPGLIERSTFESLIGTLLDHRRCSRPGIVYLPSTLGTWPIGQPRCPRRRGPSIRLRI